MFFKAITNDVEYEIDVWETRLYWCVKLKSQKMKEISYKIHKKNYQYLDNVISLIFKNSSYLVDVVRQGTTEYTVYTKGSFRTIEILNDEMLLHKSLTSKTSFDSESQLNSEMPGKVVKVFVQPGKEVKKEDPLLIIEAMKMENEIRATRDTKIEKIHVSIGDNVDKGSPLISFAPL